MTRPRYVTDSTILTRQCVDHRSPAETAIFAAMAAVEMAGASPCLTEAVNHLHAAANAVADHVEGYPLPSLPSL